MLFSNEMRAAALDDAKANGWSDPDGSPFNYAVAGHDPDESGIDGAGAKSTCCQCYQLVFEKPEPGSAQPPAIPIPKPLIVQSFNTAAGGAKNFDIFMGVGGFGAFNACVNDPTFANTSKFGKFMYQSFPTEFPGNGGVKFLSYDECKVNGLVTADSIKSTKCQQKIETTCGQTRGAGPLAQTTKDSCIQSNRVESLYHQNWDVRVKRVECPENLTRVTGCRLENQGLPKPDPNAKTAAEADPTFKAGYTTTTMQDCCKPTCAWKNWVADMGLKSVGEWRSFYSCDANGTPITTQ
jgi:hypothetical protein